MTTLCQPCEPLGKLLVRKWSRVSRGEQVDLKTGKMPKQSTIEKYHIKDEEIKECMEEVVFCQPCEKEFYKKNGRWHCLCDKRITHCSNTKCKAIGLRLGLKVGGSICQHNRRRSQCKDCGGASICEHNRQRSQCKICDPQGHIANLRRNRRRIATYFPNPTRTLDDLCMTSKEWYAYLSKTFEDTYGRPRNESDEVNIDEIIPCSAWNLPDDNKYCWHYLNSQWLLAEDNLSKHDSYSQTDKVAMIERIEGSPK